MCVCCLLTFNAQIYTDDKCKDSVNPTEAPVTVAPTEPATVPPVPEPPQEPNEDVKRKRSADDVTVYLECHTSSVENTVTITVEGLGSVTTSKFDAYGMFF